MQRGKREEKRLTLLTVIRGHALRSLCTHCGLRCKMNLTMFEFLSRLVVVGLLSGLVVSPSALAAPVSGSTTFRPLFGVALDSEAGTAIINARVVLRAHGRIIDETITDQDGQFQFEAVANGDYVIQLALFSDQGDLYGYPQLTEWSKGAFDRHHIHLSDGIPLPPIRLLGLGHIYQGQAVTGKVSGQVTMVEGHAVSEGEVSLLSQVSRVNPLVTTSTDKDGRFTLKYDFHVNAWDSKFQRFWLLIESDQMRHLGEYTLDSLAESSREKEESPPLVVAAGVASPSIEGAKVVKTKPSGGRFRIRVVNAQTQQPISHFVLYPCPVDNSPLSMKHRYGISVYSTDGEFAIDANPDDEYDVHVDAKNYRIQIARKLEAAELGLAPVHIISLQPQPTPSGRK